MTERSLFITALELQDSGQRSAYLDEACRGDQRLRERVDALLRAHNEADEFMTQPATVRFQTPVLTSCIWQDGREQDDVTSPSGLSPDNGCGMQIGRYKLLQQIGDGGFGVVYMAEQVEPVHRKVALKIIRPGMDTKEVIARFEAERQALAMMDHPNIARVLDAGTTDEATGDQETSDAANNSRQPPFPLLHPAARPYFVMELVSGVPITEYCDANQATVRERLELFVTVCRAVQHAHQKGIIHRDLKPSNIMVTVIDGRAVPKIIDFGVAKALGQELTERTLFTAYGQVIGTPAYMSPEQAEISGVDLDTRSDIYALGVLLYELLTGRTPLDPERLRGTTYAEMQRIIRDEEPARPSTRLNELRRLGRLAERDRDESWSARRTSRSDSEPVARSSDESELDFVARQRGSDPERLLKEVAGDLDWIVMKALEKDRSRRYETAGAIARDVERHLRDEPIEARAPSHWYRFRKFARRHKRAFSAAAAIAVLLTTAFVGLAVSNIRIRREQSHTAAERDRAEKAQRLAELRAAENREHLERLKTAIGLVGRARVYIDYLQWDDADRLLTSATQLRPEYATAWAIRGQMYARLGLWDLAAADLAKAFELQEPALAADWFVLALLQCHLGDSTAYRELCSRMTHQFIGTNRRHFAMDLVRACSIGPEGAADPAGLVAIAAAAVRTEPRVAWFLHVLGLAHYRAGQYEAAIARLTESLDVDPHWTGRAVNYPVLAMAYHHAGRHADARQALDQTARTLDAWTAQRHQSGDSHRVIYQAGAADWPIPWWDWMQCALHYREARALLGLPAAEDGRLQVLRARTLAALKRYDSSVAEFARVLEQNPSDPRLRLELQTTLGYYHATRREWKLAAVAFGTASQLEPAESYLSHFQAVCHLADNDIDSYRQVCEEMLDRFGDTQDPRAAHALTEVCTLAPRAVPDLTQVLAPAQVAATWYPGASRLLGALQFRLGDFDSAVKTIEAANTLHRSVASDLVFLSMAYDRLGKIDVAHRRLEEAKAWIDHAHANQLEDNLSGTRPAWGRWDERVVFPLLLREAEAHVREMPTQP